MMSRGLKSFEITVQVGSLPRNRNALDHLGGI